MEYTIGQPISEELSAYLKKWTGKEDRIEVNAKINKDKSIVNKVSTSTIRDLVYRNNSVTENNCIAITELMRLAIRNCHNKRESATEAEEYFNELLDVNKSA